MIMTALGYEKSKKFPLPIDALAKQLALVVLGLSSWNDSALFGRFDGGSPTRESLCAVTFPP